MERWIQTKIEDFEPIRENKSWQEIDEHNRLAMKRIYETHISKMEKMFNQIFERLFSQEYVKRC